jgi:ribonuclease R
MKQAVYSPDNIGHFGLSLKAYAHFTSPIRRYPDLVVHRAIKAIIDRLAQQKSKTGGKSYSVEEVEQLGEQCSMAERRADDATRDVADWLKCEFMQDHVGSVFEGVVVSVTNFGLFVRITEYQIDGLVHITSLGNDFYHFDDTKQCLVGEASGVSYRLGDKVEVKVASVNLDDRKIDLLLEGAGSQERVARKTAKKRSSSKSNKTDSGKKKPGSTTKRKPRTDKPKASTKNSRKKAGPSKSKGRSGKKAK